MNIVIIAAELALYLPVSVLGYLCDRIGPAPLSLMASVMFGTGYILAAFTYKSGAKDVMGYTHERGWPLWVMVVAFVIIGLGTTCMYLSAVTTCAKNFGKSKYRGIALASPIAAFGLSGMWQSQFGARVLFEKTLDGSRGDVDVFKYFVFLAITLVAVGLVGTIFLRIVDEDELIDEAVEELERSGLLEDSEFFRRTGAGTYGSISDLSDEEAADARRLQEAKDLEDEEARKKTWLLNEETSRFLKDKTMWFLAAGFFFVSGTFVLTLQLLSLLMSNKVREKLSSQIWELSLVPSTLHLTTPKSQQPQPHMSQSSLSPRPLLASSLVRSPTFSRQCQLATNPYRTHFLPSHPGHLLSLYPASPFSFSQLSCFLLVKSF